MLTATGKLINGLVARCQAQDSQKTTDDAAIQTLTASNAAKDTQITALQGQLAAAQAATATASDEDTAAAASGQAYLDGAPALPSNG